MEKPSPILQEDKVACEQVYNEYKTKAILEAYIEEIN